MSNTIDVKWKPRKRRYLANPDTRTSPNYLRYVLFPPSCHTHQNLDLFPHLSSISLVPRPHTKGESGDIRIIPQA